MPDPERLPAEAAANAIFLEAEQHHPELPAVDAHEVAHALIHLLARVTAGIYHESPDEIAGGLTCRAPSS